MTDAATRIAELEKELGELKSQSGTRLKTSLTLLLDESGSMGPEQMDVIGGINTFLAEQRKDTSDDLVVTMTKFDTEYRPLCANTPIADVQDLTKETYQPRGSTALLDAVYKTIQEAAAVTADRHVFLVYTDGEENASREVTREAVTKLIAEKEALGNWTFVFMAANPAAFHEGVTSGFQTASYAGNSYGATNVVMSASVSNLRASAATADSTFGSKVQAELDKEAKKKKTSSKTK